MAFEREVQDFKAEGTDLPESKLETGFLAGEKPPANWFNSLIYRLTQATKELQEKAIEQEYVDSKVEEASGNIGNITKDLEEVKTEIETKAETVVYEATIPSSGWSENAPFFVDVAVTGILETDTPLITPKYSGKLEDDQSIQEAWNLIDRVVAKVDGLRVYAFEEVPTSDIPVQIQVVR